MLSSLQNGSSTLHGQALDSLALLGSSFFHGHGQALYDLLQQDPSMTSVVRSLPVPSDLLELTPLDRRRSDASTNSDVPSSTTLLNLDSLGPSVGTVLRSNLNGVTSRANAGSLLQSSSPAGSPFKRPSPSSDDSKMEVSFSSTSSSERSSVSPSIVQSVIVKDGGRKKKMRDVVKDEAYWQRRKKNNDAAKRSRDIRRIREDEVSKRATSLERENNLLKIEVEQLRSETDSLRSLVSASLHQPSSFANLGSLGGYGIPPSLLAEMGLLGDGGGGQTTLAASYTTSSILPSDSSSSGSPCVSSTTSPTPAKEGRGGDFILHRPIPIHPHSVIARTSVLISPPRI